MSPFAQTRSKDLANDRRNRQLNALIFVPFSSYLRPSSNVVSCSFRSLCKWLSSLCMLLSLQVEQGFGNMIAMDLSYPEKSIFWQVNPHTGKSFWCVWMDHTRWKGFIDPSPSETWSPSFESFMWIIQMLELPSCLPYVACNHGPEDSVDGWSQRCYDQKSRGIHRPPQCSGFGCRFPTLKDGTSSSIDFLTRHFEDKFLDMVKASKPCTCALNELYLIDVILIIVYSIIAATGQQENKRAASDGIEVDVGPTTEGPTQAQAALNQVEESARCMLNLSSCYFIDTKALGTQSTWRFATLFNNRNKSSVEDTRKFNDGRERNFGRGYLHPPSMLFRRNYPEGSNESFDLQSLTLIYLWHLSIYQSFLVFLSMLFSFIRSNPFPSLSLCLLRWPTLTLKVGHVVSFKEFLTKEWMNNTSW